MLHFDSLSDYQVIAVSQSALGSPLYLWSLSGTFTTIYVTIHPYQADNLTGRGMGLLPGSESGPLSTTLKCIVRGDTQADKAKDFIEMGAQAKSSRLSAAKTQPLSTAAK